MPRKGDYPKRVGDNKWLVRWRGAGIHHQRTFRTRKEAEVFLATVTVARHRGDYIDPTRGRKPFGEWAAEVGAARADRRLSTVTRDETLMRTLVLPTFGPMPLAAIRQITVQSWVAQLNAKGYAPATTRKAVELLAGVMSRAVAAELLPRSPCRDIDLPRLEQTEMRFLSAAEVGQLADAIDPRYRVLVLTAAYTGCRFGELAALRPDRIDFLRRTIRIEETLNEVRGQIVIGPPKTRKARRAVSIPSFLADILAAHVAGKPADGYVFSGPEGGPLRRNTFRHRFWQPAVRASVGGQLRFHDLRHSHVAMLIGSGVHPRTAADRLGHSSVRTLLDVYGHLLEGLDGAAADALDAAFRTIPAAQAPATVTEIGRG